MVTGRVGAAMSAEIGTMKVTEQIDALRALAVHPVDYLVVPRMLAMMISMPLLVAECIGFGTRPAYFVSVNLLGINGPYYVANMVRWTLMRDIIMGLTKGFCFAHPDRFHQLPQRTQQPRRRRRSRPGDDRGGGQFIARDFDLEFLSDHVSQRDFPRRMAMRLRVES